MKCKSIFGCNRAIAVALFTCDRLKDAVNYGAKYATNEV